MLTPSPIRLTTALGFAVAAIGLCACTTTQPTRATGTAPISAPQGEWVANCMRDSLRNTSYCLVTRYGSKGFVIWVTSAGPTIISTKGNHHPGTSLTIRVDNNPPVNADDPVNGRFSASQAKKLVAEMLQGQTAQYGGTTWPGKPYRGVWQTSGLAGALGKARAYF